MPARTPHAGPASLHPLDGCMGGGPATSSLDYGCPAGHWRPSAGAGIQAPCSSALQLAAKLSVLARDTIASPVSLVPVHQRCACRAFTGASLAQVLWQLTSLGTLASDYQVDASIDPTFTTGVTGLPQATLQNNNTVFITTDASPSGRRCMAQHIFAS